MSIVLLASVHAGLLIIVLIQSIIIILLPRVIGDRLKKLRAAYPNTMGLYISLIKDSFTGFEVVKTFHIEEKVSQEHENNNRLVADVDFRFSRMNLLGRSATSFVNYIFLCVHYG